MAGPVSRMTTETDRQAWEHIRELAAADDRAGLDAAISAMEPTEAIRAILVRPERPNPANDLEVSAELEPGGGVLWPTLEPSEQNLALSALVGRVTARLGLSAEAIARGGASDAANAAAVGTPAICGLGPVTQGIHTDEEHTSIRAIGHSVRVAAALLAEIAAGA